MPGSGRAASADHETDEQAFIRELVRRNQGLSASPPGRGERREEAAVRRRWQRWLRFGGGRDWGLLKRRMKAEGLRPGALYQADRLSAAPAQWPAWARLLPRLLHHARVLAARPDLGEALLPPGAAALPFAQVLLPGLLLARELRTCPDPECLGPDALQGLELALLERLGEIAASCLYTLFDAQRGISPQLLALYRELPEAPRESYAAFVRAQLAGGYRELGERWPVCLRLLAGEVQAWAAVCDEFLTRLERDYGAIRASFFDGAPAPGPLAALEATASDPHAGGRRVLGLVFASGARLIYKPRPLDMEVLFNRSLAWMNQEAGAVLPRQRLTRLLPREDYGWMEWVEASPLAPGEETLFHRRLGGLLALFRAMQGVDMHLENLVAAGSYPVFVDVECLLHPSSLPFLEMDNPAASLDAELPRELFSLGILPFHSAGARDGRLVDFGGIARQADPRGVEVSVFRQSNSDWMVPDRAPQVRSTHHQPRRQEGWVDALAQAPALAAAYGETLAWLLSRRDWLLSDAASPWQGLSAARGRHLARSTWTYGTLMEAALAPEALEDGIMFDLSFEALYRNMPLLAPGYRAMAPAERQDLRHLDVPRFGFRAGSRQLLDAQGQALGEVHAWTPFQSMAARLQALTPEQVAVEAACLERVLTPYQPPADGGLATLGAQLLAQRLILPSGRQLWLGLGNHGDGICVRPLGPGLYDGSAGLALALAAAGRVQGCAATRAAAGGLLADLLTLFELAGPPGPGYDRGMAGLLVAGLHVAELGGDEALAARLGALARCWAEILLQGGRQPGNQPTDLLNGQAGLLLAWLHCQRRWPGEAAFLAAATQAGEQLLARARRTPLGLAWPQGKHGLSGLSHGGSGYALALAALYRASGAGHWRAAAFAALAHEAALFVPEWGNWRDLRHFQGDDPGQCRQQGCSWCHGAPGIALARAALLRLLDGDLAPGERGALEQELEVALATTCRVLAKDAGPPLDDLCCGRAGGADILLECGRLLERPELMALGHREAGRRADPGRWRYWFTGKELAGTDLSLFKGSAGQVYLQARLAALERVPCILLPWQGD